MAVSPQQSNSSAPAASVWQTLADNSGKIGGVLAFVVGGVGTIVAAIGDFGSDDSGLATARRNHVDALIAASSAAAAGLMLGMIYVLIRRERLDRRITKGILGAGVILVSLGVGIGAYATTNRHAGRPTIHVARVDDSSISVVVSGDGLASDDWFEAIVEGYTANPPGKKTELAAARFSPGQDGKLDWKERIQVPKKFAGSDITYLLVRVRRNNPVEGRAADCSVSVETTCLFFRIPTTVASTDNGS
jgi:hypothetical protein